MNSFSKEEASKKEKLKICHLADIHLGYRKYNKITQAGFNQRESDINQAFQEAVDNIIRLKPNLVLIAGDLFHSVRPSNSVITFCFRQLRRLAEQTKSPIVIIAGNHDSPKKVDSGSLLKLFNEIEGVYIADKEIKKFIFKELSVAVTCVPHFALMEFDKSQIRADDNYMYNFLLIHGQVGSEVYSDFGGADLNLKDIVIGEWDYIALGYVHIYQEIADNMAYSGSIEHTSKNIWSEAEYNKGFLEIYFPEKRKVFYSLTNPREVKSLQSIDVKNYDPEQVMQKLQGLINSVAGGIDGKIIRIELKNMNRNVYANLDHKEIRKWRARALNLLIDYSPSQSNQSNRVRDFTVKKPLKMEIQEFCSNQKQQNSNEITSTLIKYIDLMENSNENSGS